MSVAKALAARTITFLLDGLQGPTNREAREILEQALADAELRRGEARGQLNEVRERAEAAEARLAALTAPVDGEPSEEALGLVWRQSVDARAESKDPFGGSQHQHRLALWRAGAAHERVRTAQLRAEVSEARADRDKALAELEAANARIAELEAPLPEATVRDLEALADDHFRLRSGWSPTLGDMRDLARAVAERVRRERCLVARAVAGGVEFEVLGFGSEGAWTVRVAGKHKRAVPAAEVPATLARMLTEVGA